MPDYLVIAAQLLCPLDRMPNPMRIHDDLVDHLAREDVRLSKSGAALRTHEGVLRSIQGWLWKNSHVPPYDLAEVE